MRIVKIAAAALNQTPLDWEGNLRNIETAITRAREQQVSILCLPEMSITGYGCEDAFHSRGIQQTSLVMLERVAAMCTDISVAVGVPILYAGGMFNTACLIVNGEIQGFVGKQHLAGDGIHYEPRWFKAWPAGIVAETKIGDKEYPLGDIIFDVGGVRIGFEICEDAWVADRPGIRCTARGANVILNPSASHFSFGKHAVRKQFAVEGSRAFHVAYVYANLLGNEAGRAIYDGDSMLAVNGELVAVGQRFSFEPVCLVSATVDIEATRMSRARSGSFEPELDGDESDVFSVDFSYPECKPEPKQILYEEPENAVMAKYEEFTRVITLGLFDYLRKSRSRGFVVSLSGGVDSAAVVVLCGLMFRYAINELGLEKFNERTGDLFKNLPMNAQPSDAEQVTGKLLTTVYQATRCSGDVTRNAAEQVAKSVGANHMLFDVDNIVENYKKIVSDELGRELAWDTDDIALQNIQARVRSPSVWMLANINNALLLSTSNRSEIAVGYATMDGDTSGGLAPIAGIDKHFLRQWLRWIETDGPEGLGPLPEIKAVNDQQPTAELRPAGSNQTDEGDLMPYEILDVIEKYAIRDKLLPLEVHTRLTSDYPDQAPKQLAEWIVRFFRLFCRNQWKRERFAPSFHVDDESLDPKTWCRFPILSGGYEYELNELKEAAGL